MADTNPSVIHIIATSGSKIPIFTGRPTDLKRWLAALKKEVMDLQANRFGVDKPSL